MMKTNPKTNLNDQWHVNAEDQFMPMCWGWKPAQADKYDQR